MKKQEIINRYAAMNKDYGSEGRNIYRCPHGHLTMARHNAKGVTPMFIECNCGARATSMMYRLPQIGPIVDRHHRRVIPHFYKVWIRPTVDDLIALSSNPDMYGTIDHVLMGGLIFKNDLENYLNPQNQKHK